MKAFGYDNIDEEVDVVYPETPIQKDNLENYSNVFSSVMTKFVKKVM